VNIYNGKRRRQSDIGMDDHQAEIERLIELEEDAKSRATNSKPILRNSKRTQKPKMQ